MNVFQYTLYFNRFKKAFKKFCHVKIVLTLYSNSDQTGW